MTTLHRRKAPPLSAEASRLDHASSLTKHVGGTSGPLLHRVRGHLLVLLEGDQAKADPDDRERLIEWQERRTRSALLHMLQLLWVLSAVKVLLVLAGVWEIGSSVWPYVGALVAMGASLAFATLTRRLVGEALACSTFVIALLIVLVDVPGGELAESTVTVGGLLLLPTIGMPLLVRLQSVAVFGLLCVLVVSSCVAIVPALRPEWLSILFYLTIAIVAGLKLRRARANMSVGYVRSMEAAILRANTDRLTGLFNRHGWFSAAGERLDATEAAGRPACLLFIDLDHFKRLNDEHGHAAGDEVLRRTGRAIRARLGPDDIGARIGGEEFVCLLAGASPAQARRFAERLRRDLAHGRRSVTFSGGLVQWSAGEDINALMSRGDQAMYQAKEHGRDRVVAAV